MRIRNKLKLKGFDPMWRDKLIEIKKAKGYSTKMIADASGISVDTVSRIFNPAIILKEGPGVETLAAICTALETELWEIFYYGDKTFVGLQAELAAIKTERDEIVAENAVLKDKVESLRNKIDTLKDEIIATHRHYIKLEK